VKLRFEIFSSPYNLCIWVNDNPNTINIISICQDEFGKYVLYYTSSYNGEEVEEFDAEKIWDQRYNKRGDREGN
jgi:hypothetical protein